MTKIAIYPGTFDPITYGHIDVIKKGLKLFNKIIVAVSDVDNKDYLFDIDERIEIVKKALFFDLKLNKNKINVIPFNTLTTDLCKKNKDEKSEIKAKEKFILSITENGYGKKTSHLDYRVTNRGGKGIIGIINSPRNGNISSSFPVFEGDEILISTNKGRVIRVAVKEIRTAGRNTQGVRIIKLSGEEKVVSAIKIDDNLI